MRSASETTAAGDGFRTSGACYVPASMEAPDADLLRAIAARSNDAPAAEAELCRRFAPRVRLYGLRHLRDEDRARDLVQAVLLAVLQAARAGRIADPERVDRFVLGTSRNMAARMREGDARSAGDAALAGIAAEDDNHETIDTAALVRCMAGLDDRARQVVMLSFNDERRSDEIATLLAISSANVRVLRHRAIAALRRCLDAPKEAA
jgi:RNA polymerase sigma-70 factor (ECF subfamily)